RFLSAGNARVSLGICVPSDCGLVIADVLGWRKLIFVWSFQHLRVEARLGASMNAKKRLSAANRWVLTRPARRSFICWGNVYHTLTGMTAGCGFMCSSKFMPFV